MVAGVLVRGTEVLLGHRSPGRRWYPDVWDLPGGHVEPGDQRRRGGVEGEDEHDRPG